MPSSLTIGEDKTLSRLLPRKGTETPYQYFAFSTPLETKSFTPITPQGDGNQEGNTVGFIIFKIIFHAYYPARGRKLFAKQFYTNLFSNCLSRLLPRKGTETLSISRFTTSFALTVTLSRLLPRKGTETPNNSIA